MRGNIIVAPEQRACFFGKTRSGKTTLAKGLLQQADDYVVVDQKNTFRDGSPIVRKYEPRKPRQIIRVPVSDYEQDDLDAVFEAIYRDRPRLVYVDELTLCNPSRTTLRAPLARLIRAGGELGFGVWCGSQRPKDIPSAVFTESEHFFVFRLQFEADRDKVASFTTERIYDYLPLIRGHQFVYYGLDEDRLEWIDPQLVRAA